MCHPANRLRERKTNTLSSPPHDGATLQTRLHFFSTPSRFLDGSHSSVPAFAPLSSFLQQRTATSSTRRRARDTMADSASESDTDGAGSSSSSATPHSSSAAASHTTTTTTNAASKVPGVVISQSRLEELTNRLASLQQENKVLKIELETFKLKCKALQEENRDLRKASVTIVSRTRPAVNLSVTPDNTLRASVDVLRITVGSEICLFLEKVRYFGGRSAPVVHASLAANVNVT